MPYSEDQELDLLLLSNLDQHLTHMRRRRAMVERRIPKAKRKLWLMAHVDEIDDEIEDTMLQLRDVKRRLRRGYD